MKQLLEDYQRRLATVKKELEKFETNCPNNPNYTRLKTKESCYRTLIAELEIATKTHSPSTEKTEERIWSVPVCRMESSYMTVDVRATSEDEAIKIALDKVGSSFCAPIGAF